MSAKKSYHPIIVPALDALIGDPDLVQPQADNKKKADEFYIPNQYIDRLHSFRDEQSSRGEAAIKLLNTFAHALETTHYSDEDVYTCANGTQIRFVGYDKVEPKSSNGRSGSTTYALATARYAQEQANTKDDVAIMTGDSYMSAKALGEDIDVAHINPDVYTGRRKLVLPEALYDSWFKHRQITAEEFAEHFPQQKPLLLNEFVEFEFDSFVTVSYGIPYGGRYHHFIGRFEPSEDGGVLRQLHYIDDLPRYLDLRSPGQAMLAEALLAPVDEIPIVVCPAIFGTGKTYLATAIGIEQVVSADTDYDRIFIVPRDAELGKDIGFLPGDERDKTIARAMPIVDNVRNYLKSKGDRKRGNTPLSARDLDAKVDSMLEQNFEFVSIINMGGRSISDSWIIYDESQDMERFQINQLMKRIGDGSKMIITGDPRQVYNRHMNYHSNGLMYAATKMAGSQYAAVVTMHEGEITRSVAAREIARCLDH